MTNFLWFVYSVFWRVTIITIICMMCLAGCAPAKPMEFEQGQCVIVSITQEKAMVTRLYPVERTYAVRVAQATKTHHAFIGADNSYTEAYATVYFREFELIECENWEFE